MPFRELIHNEARLTGIGIDITEKCNRKCPTCFAQHSPRDMELPVFQKIIDEACALHFPELYILGGEPGIVPKILEFLEYAQEKFALVIFVTNMDKFSDVNFCRQIFDTGVIVAGQRHVLGEDAQSQDIERLLTGGNHLHTSNTGWKNVEEIFPPERVCVQCCITRPVVDSHSIFEVFRWARKKGYEPVMEFTKEGGGFKRGCSLDITPAEMMEVLLEFQRIDKEEYRNGITLLGPQAYGKTCHMIENSVHFLVDGMAVPCVGHHDIGYGNIASDTLASILDNPLRQAMKNPHDWIYGYCSNECPHFDLCTGGCRGSAFDITGCPRASFYYCPHIPRERLSLADMIPPSCEDCILKDHPACNPKR